MGTILEKNIFLTLKETGARVISLSRRRYGSLTRNCQKFEEVMIRRNFQKCLSRQKEEQEEDWQEMLQPLIDIFLCRRGPILTRLFPHPRRHSSKGPTFHLLRSLP
jgi:hypothetical protein